MAINEEIARLTGTLKINADTRPLVTFEKRLASVEGKLRAFSELTNKKFNIKVTLDARQLRAQLDKAAAAKITFRNFSIDATTFDLFQKRIVERLERTPIHLKNVKINVSDILAQRAMLRGQLGNVAIEMKVALKMKEAERALRAWKTATEEKFKLYLNADISGAKLYRNASKTLRAIGERLGTFTIKSPKINLTVDRQHLKAEIASVLQQIQREVRIKIDLNSRVSGSPRGSRGGSSGGSSGSHRSPLAREGMGMARGFIPGLGAAYALSKANEINQQMQGQQLAMTAVMGSKESGAEQSKWVKDLGNKIGFDYRVAAPSYNKMLASGKTSGMSTGSVQNIFQGVSEYGRVMGLGGEAMKGSLVAIEQMMNKGQIMSEELKGQLAERMPGAMSAMAEAAGFGTDDKAVGKLMDAMKAGNVKSKDVLEKFGGILAARAREGGALEAAMKSTGAEQARMNNAFTDSIMSFSEGGFDAGTAKFFRVLTEAMNNMQPAIKSLGAAFEVLMTPVYAAIRLFSALGGVWPAIADGLGLSTKQLTAFAGAAAIFLLPFGGVVAAVSAFILVLDDLLAYSRGGKSFFGAWLASSPDAQKAFDDLKVTADQFGTNLKALYQGVQDLGGALKSVGFTETFINTMNEIKSIMDAFNTTVMRLVAAGTYSQMRARENGEDGLLERNGNNIKALYEGPDWVNQQIANQTNKNGTGSPQIPGQQSASSPEEAQRLALRAMNANPIKQENMSKENKFTFGDIKIEFNGPVDPESVNNIVGEKIADAFQKRLAVVNSNIVETK